jgi:outer membrane protein, heavy metal efflux system
LTAIILPDGSPYRDGDIVSSLTPAFLTIVMMRLAQVSIAVVFLSLPIAWSQTAPPLSLKSALEMAEQRNLDLAAARERAAFAQAGIQVARQRPNPNLTFSASRDTPHEGFLFEQPLEIGPKRSRRIEVAREEAGVTEAEIAVLERQVRRNVREAFHTAVFAKGVSARRQRLLDLARRLQTIAQERFNAGDVAQLEVIQTDVEVARADAEFQLAQQEENVALGALNALLNQPAGSTWQFSDSLETFAEIASVHALTDQAYQANPEIKRATRSIAVEQSRVNLLRAERIPDFHVAVGSDFDSPGEFNAGPKAELSVGLPLFSRNQGEIAQASANERRAEKELAAAKRTISSRIEAAYLEFQARRNQVTIFRQTVIPAAQRLTQLSEESYRAGKSGILTVIDAQRNASELEQNFLDSELQAQKTFAELEEAVGVPLD